MLLQTKAKNENFFMLKYNKKPLANRVLIRKIRAFVCSQWLFFIGDRQ